MEVYLSLQNQTEPEARMEKPPAPLGLYRFTNNRRCSRGTSKQARFKGSDPLWGAFTPSFRYCIIKVLLPSEAH